jgi:hypothetical protein
MKHDAIDALLEEIDRIARSYNLDRYGLPIKSDHLNHAEPTQAMREAVSRFVEEVKRESRQILGEPSGKCGKNMGNDLLVIPCDLPKGHAGECERNIWPVNGSVADAALPSAPQKCPRCGSEKKHQFVWNYSRHNGCTEDAYHEFHNGWEDSVPDAVPPAQREAEGAPETTLFGGWEMTEAQIRYMVERFLGWRLPDNFNPDAGISFKRDFNEHTAHPMKHEPVGTNLFDAVQTEAMVRYLVDGMPQSVASECSAAQPTKAEITDKDRLLADRIINELAPRWDTAEKLHAKAMIVEAIFETKMVLAGADRSPDTEEEELCECGQPRNSIRHSFATANSVDAHQFKPKGQL